MSFFRREKPTDEEQLVPDSDPNYIPGKFMLVKSGFEDDGRIRVEVEYDDEFVLSLRKRGYIGTDAEQIVMQYIGDVHRTIVEDVIKNYE